MLTVCDLESVVALGQELLVAAVAAAGDAAGVHDAVQFPEGF